MPSRPRPAWWWAAAIVLLALNLRVAVTSVGVVIEPLRDDLGIGTGLAGVITALPVLCFAVVGSLTPRLVGRLGLDRTAAALLVVATVGLAARATADSAATFVPLSVLALAAAAVGNVILPALARQHLPDHLSTVGAAYGAALLGGAALASAVTVPVANAVGGWRSGIGVWAVLAAAAAVPWLVAARRGSDAPSGLRTPSTIGLATLARSRRAWVMAAFFGAQSAQAYAQFGWFAPILDDAGLSTASAGAMLALLALVGVPITLALPRLIAWTGDGPVLPWIFSSLVVGGWLGVLLAPTAAPWLWASMLGAGGVAFPWFLTQINRRATTVDGTAALSGFAQSAGYLIAIVGPLGVGILHEASGSWDVAVVVLAVEALLIGILGTWVARPGTVEDDLARS